MEASLRDRSMARSASSELSPRGSGVIVAWFIGFPPEQYEAFFGDAAETNDTSVTNATNDTEETQ